MPGVIGAGRQFAREAIEGMGAAARMETARESVNRQIEAAEKSQQQKMTMQGAAIGAKFAPQIESALGLGGGGATALGAEGAALSPTASVAGMETTAGLAGLGVEGAGTAGAAALGAEAAGAGTAAGIGAGVTAAGGTALGAGAAGAGTVAAGTTAAATGAVGTGALAAGGTLAAAVPVVGWVAGAAAGIGYLLSQVF